MPRPDVDLLDEQIERIRGGGTLVSPIDTACAQALLH